MPKSHELAQLSITLVVSLCDFIFDGTLSNLIFKVCVTYSSKSKFVISSVEISVGD